MESSYNISLRIRTDCFFLLAWNSHFEGGQYCSILRELLLRVDQRILAQRVDGQTILSFACKHGLRSAVKSIMVYSCCAHLLNLGTPRPLWIAANEGHAGVIRILSERVETVDVEGSTAPDGTTPLMMAVGKENREALSALRARFYSDDEVTSALVEFGREDLLEEFHIDGASDGLLDLAVRSGNAKVVRWVLARKPDLGLQLLIPPTNSVGIRRLLGHGTHRLESFLTRMSSAFPQFNESMHAHVAPVWKEFCGKPSLSVESDIRPIILRKFCCFRVGQEKELDVAKLVLLPCNKDCNQ